MSVHLNIPKMQEEEMLWTKGDRTAPFYISGESLTAQSFCPPKHGSINTLDL